MFKPSEPFMVEPIPRAPVSQPDISPDGGRVLFTHRTLNKEKDRYESSIWIAEVDGEDSRRFTFWEGNDSAPRWSPDGRNIIFLSGVR
jgi:dipeptidyl aminopeptidase/acylaminoacyl peptidase